MQILSFICFQDVEESLAGIGTIEEWLWKAQKILHYNHVWILEMEFQLVVAYSRLIEEISCQTTADCGKQILRPMRERVVQMTMHLLEVRTATSKAYPIKLFTP